MGSHLGPADASSGEQEHLSGKAQLDELTHKQAEVSSDMQLIHDREWHSLIGCVTDPLISAWLEVFLDATALKLLEGTGGIESFVPGCAHDTISQKL
ncbi:hypothetical protein XENOCAPTIV_003316 [Xenoophorus captivus]|uniref:Uncharacterized protein n=1 Tax=Xenoophorus captivus TaxID=1517983 RepID=A0ABV0QG86_9TELE